MDVLSCAACGQPVEPARIEILGSDICAGCAHAAESRNGAHRRIITNEELFSVASQSQTQTQLTLLEEAAASLPKAVYFRPRRPANMMLIIEVPDKGMPRESWLNKRPAIVEAVQDRGVWGREISHIQFQRRMRKLSKAAVQANGANPK